MLRNLNSLLLEKYTPTIILKLFEKTVRKVGTTLEFVHFLLDLLSPNNLSVVEHSPPFATTKQGKTFSTQSKIKIRKRKEIKSIRLVARHWAKEIDRFEYSYED